MKTKVRKFWLPALILPLALTGCTQGKQYDTLQAQVSQQNQATQQLNMQLSGVQPALADTWSQLQSLRQEVAALRGEVDTMNHALTLVGGAQGMADALSRHDRALRLIETQLALDLQLNQPGAPVPAAMAGGLPGASVAPGAAGAAGVMGGVGGASAGVSGGASGDPMGAAGTAGLGGTTAVTEQPAGSASASSPARPVTADTAQALYDAGMSSFNNRQYTQALKAFTDFTTTYAKHNLVSNSWFWQGESNFQLKNYAAAALAYEKVISGFANSNKAPAAYLKQAMSFIQLDKKDAARERLNQLLQKYPKAPEATRAKQVLSTLK